MSPSNRSVGNSLVMDVMSAMKSSSLISPSSLVSKGEKKSVSVRDKINTILPARSFIA